MVTSPTIPDLPELAEAIEGSADATLARGVLERVVESEPAIADALREHALLGRGLVALACASRSLSTAIVADPSLLAPLREPAAFHAERGAGQYRAAWREAAVTAGLAPGRDPGGPASALLRRWKRRELVRIAARDLLGVADLPAVGRELAALAGACLQAAVEIAGAPEPFAVVGMGKLGGRELNYSSDVDVLFVHDGDPAAAERAARAVLATMASVTADGLVFRTDADLRPEGRAGPLSRDLGAYRSYYDRWGQGWEFQALLKARPVAGDGALGEAFLSLAERYVWPAVLDADFVREARAMKARSESETARRGLSDREVKRGRGGIRDIEFAVQLLQLVHGRHDPTIRSKTTLDALGELAAGGYVEAEDRRRLTDAYVFLRTVEHRIQLRDEQQTHTIPTDRAARTLLARVMGYRDGPGADASETFDADLAAHQGAARAIHERLYFAPLLDALAGVGTLAPDAVEERFAAFGFVDTDHTRRALRELQQGFSRVSRVMRQLLPLVLDWLSVSPDPDLGLLQLRRLAEGPTRALAVASTFRESPTAAERACRLLGSSRVLGDALLRQPEFVDELSQAELGEARTRDELVAAALETLAWRPDAAARRSGLRRFARREWLRLAARDVLGLAEIETTEREHTALADALVESALGGLAPPVPFAVVGMGRLGGRELSYASDLDLVFVYDGSTAADFAAAERVATMLLRELGEATGEGLHFDVDLRLRPEGKGGSLARSLDGFRGYYERYVEPWERQSLLRARLVAGDADLGAGFLAMTEPVVYRDPLPVDDLREIRRVKARVERERMPRGEDPEFHLKLGRGALVDVEFAVQLLQLRHGAPHPEIRDPSTTGALARLAAAGVLEPADADTLLAAYRFCERARNATFLVTGRPNGGLPGGFEGVRVARLLGYTEQSLARMRNEFRRLTRRSRRVFERVFFEREQP